MEEEEKVGTILRTEVEMPFLSPSSTLPPKERGSTANKVTINCCRRRLKIRK